MISFGVVRTKHPPKKTNSYERTVVKADTPIVTVTEGDGQYCAPWIVESPGGTVTTSAYHDGKKRCMSAEGGSGDPRKKVSEQNKTSTRAYLFKSSKLKAREVGQTTKLSGSGNTRAKHLHFLFPCQIATRSFLNISTPPRPFLPRAPHLQVASSRDIVQLQTGQFGCQMVSNL